MSLRRARSLAFFEGLAEDEDGAGTGVSDGEALGGAEDGEGNDAPKPSCDVIGP